MSEQSWAATAQCRACGEAVTRLEAPLHIEEHQQRGQTPTPPAADRTDR